LSAVDPIATTLLQRRDWSQQAKLGHRVLARPLNFQVWLRPRCRPPKAPDPLQLELTNWFDFQLRVLSPIWINRDPALRAWNPEARSDFGC
jgi:hypothetical protein